MIGLRDGDKRNIMQSEFRKFSMGKETIYRRRK